MANKNTRKDIDIQYHVDRWADLMKRIIKNPEIADRIPNHANLLFAEDDLVLINGEPMRFNELVRTEHRKKTDTPVRKKTARASG